MKIIINENQLIDKPELLKDLCFKRWNKKGYATSHPTFLNLLAIPKQLILSVENLVSEWNKIHNITPLSFLEKDFGPFYNSTVSNHIYMWPNKRGVYRDIEVSNGKISAVVRIHSMDYNENDKTLDVYCEVPVNTLRDIAWNGKTFSQQYPYGYENNDYDVDTDDGIDEDEYWDIYDDYRGEVNWLVNRYFYKNYTSKMGGVELEIEHY